MADQTWHAARASTQAAEAALDDHKLNCPDCATPRKQMCATGRGLLNHLWDCQQAQSEAWHKRYVPPDQPDLFAQEDSRDSPSRTGLGVVNP